MEVGCQAARAGRDAVPVEVNNFDIDVSIFIFPMLREGTYLASQTAHWCSASLRYVRTFYFRNIVFHLSKHSSNTFQSRTETSQQPRNVSETAHQFSN